MADGFEVDAEQIRQHARNIDALRIRFVRIGTARWCLTSEQQIQAEQR
ncbi:hypothetical protein [Micromonospora vulcania]|uniref:Uncharacterized protein n=1 Tax=Micromonospora vulcania TaxID=1441873 RepID=A0ABW1H9W6_9ACTN